MAICTVRRTVHAARVSSASSFKRLTIPIHYSDSIGSPGLGNSTAPMRITDESLISPDPDGPFETAQHPIIIT